MNLETLEFHPLSEHLSLLSEEETQVMADDVKKNGLLERLTLLDGKVLDGRNRYNACKIAGRKLTAEDIELFEEAHEGEDPAVYVISKNIKRRHLTVGQRAAMLAELLKEVGKAKPGPKEDPILRAAASELMQDKSENAEVIPKTEQKKILAKTAGVSVDAVDKAAYIEKVAPEVHAEVKAGTITLSKGEKAAKARKPPATPEEHNEALEKIEKVCGKKWVAAIREDQVPGLLALHQVLAFSKLPDAEMRTVRELMYRAEHGLDEARKFTETYIDHLGKLKPDWNWRVRDFLVFMSGKDAQETRQFIKLANGGELRVTVEWVTGKNNNEQNSTERARQMEGDSGHDECD
jgi:hypothetical protein